MLGSGIQFFPELRDEIICCRIFNFFVPGRRPTIQRRIETDTGEGRVSFADKRETEVETEDHVPESLSTGPMRDPLKELSAHDRITAVKRQFDGKVVGHELFADITLPVEEERG